MEVEGGLGGEVEAAFLLSFRRRIGKRSVVGGMRLRDPAADFAPSRAQVKGERGATQRLELARRGVCCRSELVG